MTRKGLFAQEKSERSFLSNTIQLWGEGEEKKNVPWGRGPISTPGESSDPSFKGILRKQGEWDQEVAPTPQVV